MVFATPHFLIQRHIAPLPSIPFLGQFFEPPRLHATHSLNTPRLMMKRGAAISALYCVWSHALGSRSKRKRELQLQGEATKRVGGRSNQRKEKQQTKSFKVEREL